MILEPEEVKIIEIYNEEKEDCGVYAVISGCEGSRVVTEKGEILTDSAAGTD